MFLVGCSEQGNQSDVADNGQIQNDMVEAANGNEAVNNFSVNFLKVTNETDNEEDNILLSPLSVAYALSMTANGAQGETLAQFEQTLGMSVEDLNKYLAAYMEDLVSEDGFKINLANSLWIDQNKGIKIKDDFIQINKQYYNAEIFETPFDENMIESVNSWVSENTDGMIDELLEEVPELAVMYLINAVCLDAKWEENYVDSDLWEDVFTSESGKTTNIDFMHSEEEYYLENESFTGVMKYYNDDRYAFVGLLPKENISLDEAISSLNGEQLQNLLNDADKCEVYTSIPKFEMEYDLNMNSVLQEMGIKDAFSQESADFTLMSDDNLYVSQVLHKTNIIVNENGTKAAAVTSAEVEATSEEFVDTDYKQVYLNRPFVYMIVDCKENIPIFMGTIKSLE